MACHKHATHHSDCYSCRQTRLHQETRAEYHNAAATQGAAVAQVAAAMTAQAEAAEARAEAAERQTELLADEIRESNRELQVTMREQLAAQQWAMSPDARAWEQFASEFAPIDDTALHLDARWDAAWDAVEQQFDSEAYQRAKELASNPNLHGTPEDTAEAATRAAKEEVRALRRDGLLHKMRNLLLIAGGLGGAVALVVTFISAPESPIWPDAAIRFLLWGALPCIAAAVLTSSMTSVDGVYELDVYARIHPTMERTRKERAAAAEVAARSDANTAVSNFAAKFGVIVSEGTDGILTYTRPVLWTESTRNWLEESRRLVAGGMTIRPSRRELPKMRGVEKCDFSELWTEQVREVWLSA